MLRILESCAGFEVSIAAVMNVAIFWDMALCSRYVNIRFGRTYHFHLQSRKSAEQETNVQQVARQNSTLVSSRTIFTLRMDVILSSETYVHVRTTRPCIPEDGNIQY
jgi:hypothetical protein